LRRFGPNFARTFGIYPRTRDRARERARARTPARACIEMPFNSALRRLAHCRRRTSLRRQSLSRGRAGRRARKFMTSCHDADRRVSHAPNLFADRRRRPAGSTWGAEGDEKVWRRETQRRPRVVAAVQSVRDRTSILHPATMHACWRGRSRAGRATSTAMSRSAGAACAAGGCDGGLSHRRTGRLHRRYGSRHCATIATAGDPTRSSPPNARRPTCAPTSRAAGRGRCGPSCAALCAGAAPRDAASRAPLLYNQQPAGRELVALTVGN